MLFKGMQIETTRQTHTRAAPARPASARGAGAGSDRGGGAVGESRETTQEYK